MFWFQRAFMMSTGWEWSKFNTSIILLFSELFIYEVLVDDHGPRDGYNGGVAIIFREDNAALGTW